MISIFLGSQNSGKTLTMTYFAYYYFKKGYVIYSNYNLKFPHKKLSKKILMDYTKNLKQFNKAIFCIDEIYLFLDSRNFASNKNKVFSWFILQSSKRNVHIIGTAQRFNTIEKRFRENVNFMCFCDRYKKVNNKFIKIESVKRKLKDIELYIKLTFLIKIETAFEDKYITKKIYLKAKDIFKLYDTRQLLSIE